MNCSSCRIYEGLNGERSSVCVSGKEQIRRLTNSFLLDSLDLKSFEFLIEYLTQIHNNRFVDLLPQMSSEDLNERDLEGRNLSVHYRAIRDVSSRCQLKLRV